MKEELIAPCGMNCGICLAYLREKRNCPGCRGDDTSKSVSCLSCIIKNCEVIKTNKSGFCFECAEYPCHHYNRLKELSSQRPHLRLQPRELERVKELGEQRWLEHQKKRWSCPECGQMFAWYDEKCSECGAKVKSSVDEVTELGLTDYPLDI